MLKKIVSLVLTIIIFIFIVTSLKSCLDFADDITDNDPKSLETLTISEEQVSLYVGERETITVYVKPYNATYEDINIIYNEEILELKWTNEKTNGTVKYYLICFEAMLTGETDVYIESGEIKSNTINFVVSEEPAPEEVVKYVYVNTSGNKYHSSKSCAGDSAYSITLESAISQGKTACSKCH